MVNSIGSGGGGASIDALDTDGTVVQRDLLGLITGANLRWSATDAGDATLAATDTHLSALDATGAEVAPDLAGVRAGANLQWSPTDSGGATLDATDTDTHLAIQQDDGTTLLADPDALREGTNIALTESEGVVTIESTAGGFTESDKQAMTTHPIPVTEIADGDYVDYPIRVPSGKTAKVWKWGARTDAQTTPNGLTVGLWDYDSASYISSESVAYATGSPRASHEGAGDLALRVENQTGGTLNVGGDFSVTIE